MKVKNMNVTDINKRIYDKKEAASYLGIKEFQLVSFTDLGWVKYFAMENGETSYQQEELDLFDAFFLIDINQIVNIKEVKQNYFNEAEAMKLLGLTEEELFREIYQGGLPFESDKDGNLVCNWRDLTKYKGSLIKEAREAEFEN